MIPEQQAAFIFAQSVGALIEAMGMLSANLAHYYRRKEASDTCTPYFRPDRFNDLIVKYGIGSNDVLGFYRQ